MIEHDGEPTIASRRIDPLLERALAADGHLADDVARALLEDERRTVEKRALNLDVDRLEDD